MMLIFAFIRVLVLTGAKIQKSSWLVPPDFVSLQRNLILNILIEIKPLTYG